MSDEDQTEMESLESKLEDCLKLSRPLRSQIMFAPATKSGPWLLKYCLSDLLKKGEKPDLATLEWLESDLILRTEFRTTPKDSIAGSYKRFQPSDFPIFAN